MDELDERYFHWLHGQIAEFHITHPTRSYSHLLQQLHNTEFVARVRYDSNRVQDGKDLRWEFLEVEGYRAQDGWLETGCSFLELMVVLSRKLAFDGGKEPHVWFWELVNNLGLSKYWDRTRRSRLAEREIADILHRVVMREYAPDGVGGFFPLRHPSEDQRYVELWYQLSAYVLERI
jgi:hypothetical protein